jgi:hypothetical protein
MLREDEAAQLELLLLEAVDRPTQVAFGNSKLPSLFTASISRS